MINNKVNEKLIQVNAVLKGILLNDSDMTPAEFVIIAEARHELWKLIKCQ